MKYKHILWDWNGTLINDTWLCCELGNQQLEMHGGKTLSVQEYREQFCFPIIEFYRKLGFDFSKVSFAELSKEFHKIYVARSHEAELHESTTRMLLEIANRGLTQSILSAQEQTILDSNIKRFGIGNHFTNIVGLDNTHAFSKVETGKQWLKEAVVAAPDILMVGDTQHDYEVAQELGIDCILVSHGFQSHSRLADHGVRIIDSLDELLSIL